MYWAVMTRKHAIFLLAIVTLASVGTGSSFAQQTPGTPIESDPAYEKADILHAFDVMEKHITLDGEKHFLINMTSATADADVTLLDIEVIEDYAVYNDDIMDVLDTTGAVGTVDEYGHDSIHIRSIIDDFENGAFRNLFSDDGSVGSVSEAVYVTYSVVPVHHGAGYTWCGGNFLDPHKEDPAPIKYGGSGSLVATQKELDGLGYHMVASYATWDAPASLPYDFSKVVPSSDYFGICDYGPFRDHAGIDNRTFEYRVWKEEPNPEIFSYQWPSAYWGVYTLWWHDNY